jgi:hypothetical protein
MFSPGLNRGLGQPSQIGNVLKEIQISSLQKKYRSMKLPADKEGV